MGDLYIKVGTTYRSYFDYSVTGLTGSDFTITVDKDGANVANTGITITNITDRRYAVVADAASSFVSGSGTFKLTVARTSIPGDRWQDVIRVTNDGTGQGGFGAASFTAAASAGRVTDGTNPIQGAYVYINRPAGAGLYAVLSTGATGLWGPIYFDANGVYTFVVQKSGYAVGSGSITVSGGTATGPTSDISLSVTATTSTTLSSLVAYARRMYRDRTGSKTDTELTQAVNEAMQMISTSSEWPWFQTIGRININGAYTTGTVSLVNGLAVVNLTGGTWPTWAASADLYIDGMYHPVLTRDSDTQITLKGAWYEASKTASFTLAQIEYQLPSDLVKIEKITSTNEWVWGPDPISRLTLEEARQRWRLQSQQPPRMFSIEKDRLTIWPVPAADKMVNILYFRRPADMVSAGDLADWDQNLGTLLHRAIDFMVACRGDCVAGDKAECYQAYKDELGRALSQNRTATSRRPGLASTGYDDLRIPGVTILG